MVVMFIIGVFLAFGFGITSGVLYAQSQRSIFTKKFTENLKKIAKEYEEQMRKIQENDQKVVENLRKTLEASIVASPMTQVGFSGDVESDDDGNIIPPPRRRYN